MDVHDKWGEEMRVERIVEYEDIHNEKCHGHPIGELIRCKECKHWNEEDHWCNIRDSYGWDYKPDDYCSYGERKESE